MRISVFITSYNQKSYLEEAVESVLSQTLRPSQVILVDDCSSDGSQEMIKGYASRYPGIIQAILHTRNTGVAKSRNDALEAVQGEFVTFLDGDDCFEPDKIQTEISIQNSSPDIGMVYSDFFYLYNDVRVRRWSEPTPPPSGEIFPHVFARTFPHRTLFRSEMVRYDDWKNVGFYDCSPPLWEDYDMRIRLSKSIRSAYCPVPLSDYRIHREGLSTRTPFSDQLNGLKYVLAKNAHLLADVPKSQRRAVKRTARAWVAEIARGFARASLESGHGSISSRKTALECYLRALGINRKPQDAALGLQILLPSRIYGVGQRAYHNIGRSGESREVRSHDQSS